MYDVKDKLVKIGLYLLYDAASDQIYKLFESSCSLVNKRRQPF